MLVNSILLSLALPNYCAPPLHFNLHETRIELPALKDEPHELSAADQPNCLKDFACMSFNCRAANPKKEGDLFVAQTTGDTLAHHLLRCSEEYVPW